MAIERYRVQVDDQWMEVSLESKGDRFIVTTPHHTWEADFQEFTGTNLVSLILGRQSLEFLVDREGDRYTVLRELEHYTVRVKPAWAAAKEESAGAAGTVGEQTVESPLVGVVLQVPVQAGQQVGRGDILAIIEAMKMQNEVRAPRAGTVKAVRVRPGQRVSARQPLVVLA